jgi:hypothetical protein
MDPVEESDQDAEDRQPSKGQVEREILADSATLVTGALPGFKEGDDNGKRKTVVEGIANAFKKGGNGSSKGQSLAGFNEALGVSNLGVDALADVNAPMAHLESLGKDRSGIASEVLGEKTTKGGRSSRRKSAASENAPKVSKIRKSAIREAVKELMPISDDSLPKNVKMEGDRYIVTVDGQGDRPIRMDTRESYAPKLNLLIQDIRRTRLHSHNREFNRVEKIRSLNKEITSLSYRRAEYSLESANWTSDNWRWVNTNRARPNPQEMLQDCAPAKRLSALRSIEQQCVAAVSSGTKPPSPARRPPAIRAWT